MKISCGVEDWALISKENAAFEYYVSPDDIDKIFEPFYTKKAMRRSGTGLGMAVVWGTVKDMSGYIDIESTEGKGTAVKIYFPITNRQVRTSRPSRHKDEYIGNGQKILVVDDDTDQLNIVSLMLEKLNYQAVTLSNGKEAVEYMETSSADLILMDMIMDPGIDGLDTLKQIWAIQPDQKAVIGSGFSENKRVYEARKLGATGFVGKPYTITKLGIVLKEALK